MSKNDREYELSALREPYLFIVITRTLVSPSLAPTRDAARQAKRRQRRSHLASTDSNPHASRVPSEQGCSRQRGGSIRCRRGDTRANPTPGVDRSADYSSGLSWAFGGERRSRGRSRRAWGGPSRCRSSSRSDHTAPNPGWPTHRGRATPRPTFPPLCVQPSLPRCSRPRAGSGVTYRLRSPVHTERRSPGRAGGPAWDRLDPTGRDAAELVVTTEEGRTYFDLAAFEAEGEVLLPVRVHVTSADAPGSHPLEVLAPAPAG